MMRHPNPQPNAIEHAELYAKSPRDLAEEIRQGVDAMRQLRLDHGPECKGHPYHSGHIYALRVAQVLEAVAPIDFIAEVQRVSIDRANRWHAGDFRQWSVLEWAGAMCGEAGEAANVAKKLRRAELSIEGNRQSERPAEFEELRRKLARECADVFLYLVLLAACYEIDLTAAIVATFNEKSIEMEFPERIAHPGDGAQNGAQYLTGATR